LLFFKPFFIFQIEQQLLDLKEIRNVPKESEPVFLIAHPTHNSLPASLETLARLQQDGNEGEIFYLNGPDDKEGLKKIINAIQCLNLWEELSMGRVKQSQNWSCRRAIGLVSCKFS